MSGNRGLIVNTLPDSLVSIDETSAEYSVCLQTKAGKVYVAEFRTLQEAKHIAQHACQRGDATVKVRHDGHDVQILRQPDCASE
ncbi:MAG: hypothetical protein ABGZ24_29635 [Fuerstiella sp.]